jgi:hypothetical protein
MTTFADFLTEARFPSGSSAILPAARVLFGKNKVTPDHAHSKEADVWNKGEQHVRTYANTDDKWDKDGKRSTVTKHFHVAGAGHFDNDGKFGPKVGEREHFFHDQSGNKLPSGTLVGAANYTDGKKVAHHGEDHSKTAAPLHVYK